MVTDGRAVSDAVAVLLMVTITFSMSCCSDCSSSVSEHAGSSIDGYPTLLIDVLPPAT